MTEQVASEGRCHNRVQRETRLHARRRSLCHRHLVTLKSRAMGGNNPYITTDVAYYMPLILSSIQTHASARVRQGPPRRPLTLPSTSNTVHISGTDSRLVLCHRRLNKPRGPSHRRDTSPTAVA